MTAGLGGWDGLLDGEGLQLAPSVLLRGQVGCHGAPHGPPQPGTTIQGPFRSLCLEGCEPAPFLTTPPTFPSPLLFSLISNPSAPTRLTPCVGLPPPGSQDQGPLLPPSCSRAPTSRALHTGLDPFLLVHLPLQIFLFHGLPRPDLRH